MADRKTFHLKLKTMGGVITYEVIKCYGYRHASLKGGVAFDREDFKEMEEKLQDLSIGFNNHCVIIIKNTYSLSEPVAMYFKDLKVFIGLVENIDETSTF